MKSKEVSDKFKSTMLKNHGFEFAQQSNDIKSKSLKTWYNNPNKEQIIIKRKENEQMYGFILQKIKQKNSNIKKS